MYGPYSETGRHLGTEWYLGGPITMAASSTAIACQEGEVLQAEPMSRVVLLGVEQVGPDETFLEAKSSPQHAKHSSTPSIRARATCVNSIPHTREKLFFLSFSLLHPFSHSSILFSLRWNQWQHSLQERPLSPLALPGEEPCQTTIKNLVTLSQSITTMLYIPEDSSVQETEYVLARPSASWLHFMSFRTLDLDVTIFPRGSAF